MQIDRGFQRRVEDWADHLSTHDYHTGASSPQDYWLSAQRHLRDMVSGDNSPFDFTGAVRREAHAIHGEARHRCSGMLKDWDKAWAHCLAEGQHMTDWTPWSERSRDRRCSVVYFARSKRHLKDLGSLAYFLQWTLQDTGYRDSLRNLLFRAVTTEPSEILRMAEYTDSNAPVIFIVDASKIEAADGVRETVVGLNSLRVPWRCDEDFITTSLRDSGLYRGASTLNWHWANFAGYEYSQIAWSLLVDMLAI